MKKLDLHGIKHNEVMSLVQDWVITEYNKGYRDLQIVTGNSEVMKSLTCDALDEVGFEYRVGDIIGVNQGYVQIESFF